MSLKENNIYFKFNKSKLKNTYNQYSNLGTIYYPLKTNSNEKVIMLLDNLYEESDGFLISNIGHYEKLINNGISPQKMCFINVLAENETVKYLYEKGVKFFNFDNLNSLESYSSYADLNESKIAIRINTMEVFNDKIMHLGANTNDCKSMIEYLKEKKCTNYGISFYLQTDIKNEINALEKMLEFIKLHFKDYNLKFINIAGVKNANEINKEYLENYKTDIHIKEIILEPGKYLVGNTIDMITKIIRVKPLENKTILIIKNGLYSGFLDILLYDKKFQFYYETDSKKLIPITHEKQSDSDYELLLCGGSSDSGDVLGKMYISEYYRDDLAVGQRIIVENIGAYFEEFFMSYGGDINKVYIEEEEENEI
jgi:Diaminopimelate decarboxylase